MEVMHALSTDERGQRQRTDAKCRQNAVVGRPRRRGQCPFRAENRDKQRYFGADYLPNRGKLGDGVVDILGVLTEFYKFVNWSNDQISLDEKI